MEARDSGRRMNQQKQPGEGDMDRVEKARRNGGRVDRYKHCQLRSRLFFTSSALEVLAIGTMHLPIAVWSVTALSTEPNDLFRAIFRDLWAIVGHLRIGYSTKLAMISNGLITVAIDIGAGDLPSPVWSVPTVRTVPDIHFRTIRWGLSHMLVREAAIGGIE
jgi:hypothetical protein